MFCEDMLNVDDKAFGTTNVIQQRNKALKYQFEFGNKGCHKLGDTRTSF